MTETKILSYTLQEWVEMFDCKEAEQAEKCLNYLDGKQEVEIEKLLDNPERGRKDWRANGLIPRWRNLTKMIVEKSSRLFKDEPPKLEVFGETADQPDEEQTKTLLDMLYASDWLNFFNNLDMVTSLLKTSIVLVQWDPIDKSLNFENLHRGNCAVVMDQTLKHPLGLIYKVSEQGKLETYRIITNSEYIDLIEEDIQGGASKVSISSRLPNPYGLVPIAIFHDTHLPRTGIYNVPGLDLIGINELYNLHIVDSEYAISWAKLSTLFLTDVSFDGDDNERYVETSVYGSAIPRMAMAEPTISAGPAKVVSLTSNQNGNASIDYKNPKVDIQPLDNVVQNWAIQIASDWSVRLMADGHGSATSGFQLVVEEIPNRELRQQRAKMFGYGFKRLYRIISTVLNTQYGYNLLDPTSDCYLEFNNPELPVDDKDKETTWDLRIAGNRASVIDYLMAELGLTQDEAELKAVEIQDYNKRFTQPTAVINTLTPNTNTMNPQGQMTQ